ncbi:DUF2244 domain-containing protein [Roseomonas sp. OT10]|uniref:DUF2244 domain-containing protein n=1 Tax=Roseomonas cutis TaxID=2897332 RepID=UPI001E46CE75|nr:DUF2244 domain-containing protein [Roseomonas sp. OT10]UFN48682.1 DUF2244 domain-containing protein [Roseomonas sp. OT10]
MPVDATTEEAASFEPVLFEAICVPQRSWTPRGFAILSGLLLGASGSAATVFALLGAWPVLGFLGLEVPLVLALVALHHRRSGRVSEVLRLSGGRLRISRTDPRGRREEASLEPYWTRVELREQGGTAGRLRLTCRGRAIEVGRCLSQPEKQDLAQALVAALRLYREPRFHNPQLEG